MSRPRLSRLASWIVLIGLWTAAVTTGGCGGGGEDGGAAVTMATVRIKNNTITKGGQANTHTIVGFTYTKSGTGSPIPVGPLALAPGDTYTFSIPTGSYQFTATYEDGDNESLQIPPDQVLVFSDSVVEIQFLY